LDFFCQEKLVRFNLPCIVAKNNHLTMADHIKKPSPIDYKPAPVIQPSRFLECERAQATVTIVDINDPRLASFEVDPRDPTKSFDSKEYIEFQKKAAFNEAFNFFEELDFNTSLICKTKEGLSLYRQYWNNPKVQAEVTFREIDWVLYDPSKNEGVEVPPTDPPAAIEPPTQDTSDETLPFVIKPKTTS